MIEKGTEKHRGMVRTIVPSIFSERNFIAKWNLEEISLTHLKFFDKIAYCYHRLTKVRKGKSFKIMNNLLFSFSLWPTAQVQLQFSVKCFL